MFFNDMLASIIVYDLLNNLHFSVQIVEICFKLIMTKEMLLQITCCKFIYFLLTVGVHHIIWPKFSTAYFLFYSLEAAGILRELANYLDAHIPNVELIASAIGVVSAIIDNVPLVAATMGMYDLSSFPQDSEFWQLAAYCAGTGGSMLVIGSAAGVAFMGMEKIDFFWYLRKVCQSFAH